MTPTTSMILLAAWFLLTASALIALMLRAHGQIQRYRDEPTSKRAWTLQRDQIESIDMELQAIKRKTSAAQLEREDLRDRIVSVGNRLANVQRRDKSAKIDEMMDQLVASQNGDEESDQEPSLPFPNQPPSLAKTVNGEIVDFR